ncbi:LPS assembly protein LptD [bacterium]|nr:LPS assembly protein LptD [bacterium]
MNFSDQIQQMNLLSTCRSIGVVAFLIAAGPTFVTSASAQSLGPFFGIDKSEPKDVGSQRLLPDNFFDTFPSAGLGDIAVEADELAFDQDRNLVIASGQVQMSYDGWFATADRAEYNRRTGDLIMIGNAVVRDPQDVVYTGDRVEVTGDFKLAFANALRMQFPNGALIEAETGNYEDDKSASSENGVYSPCGLCVDENGNTIGWRVKTTKAIINHENQTMYLEQPSLEILGIPIATIPFYWMPDPTDPRAPGFRLPRASYKDDLGVIVSVPLFVPLAANTDFWLTPTLMSRQGGMLDGELTHRLENGKISVRAAGTYQLDRSAFVGEVGDRDWRGAIHTSATFKPIEDWAVGWSYLAFTDTNFTKDYGFQDYSSTNTVFAQHLSENTFFDIRAQEFIQTGPTVTQADQDEQALTWPVARLDHVVYLPEEFGQLDISGDFINLTRAADDQRTKGGVTSVYGYEGSKVHGTLELDWSKEFNQLGGLVATPFVGLRVDAANYDGASALNPVPTSLLSATPIAAIDLRYPFLGIDGYNSHLFEPIAQLVYRGSSTSNVGINNDNALGFIFEDSNLFSYNRFSGSDRQETGLRANVGGQYLGNFEDGSWVRFVANQFSFLMPVPPRESCAMLTVWQHIQQSQLQP